MLPGQVCKRGENTAPHVWPRASAPQTAAARAALRTGINARPCPPLPRVLCSGHRCPSPWGGQAPRAGLADGKQMEKVSVTGHRTRPSSTQFHSQPPWRSGQQFSGPCLSPSSPGPGPGPFPGSATAPHPSPAPQCHCPEECGPDVIVYEAAPLTAPVTWRL